MDRDEIYPAPGIHLEGRKSLSAVGSILSLGSLQAMAPI
jgi:hypothetical protein